MRILIVDDEFVSRQKAMKILSSIGECDIAVDGQEAVNAFKEAHQSGEPYTLITMDINMPDMSGLDALKVMREWEEGNTVKFDLCAKVLMLTATSDTKTIFTSFREGCEAYLVKPFNKKTLYEALDKLEIKEVNKISL
jgi:two-component system chemotaxis response regulator CheY